MTATRTECKKYTLIGTGAFTVKDLDGATIASGDFSSSNYALTIPSEGVYIIEDETGQYTLIELCKLVECLITLLQALFCSDDTTSLCPEGCTDTDLVKLRASLNKLVAGYGLFLLAIFHERVEYYQVLVIDDCRMEKLRLIDQFISDLQKITDKCGAGCGHTETPCSQC